MENSVEWCWHGVAVQGKCPFKRQAVKGGVKFEIDQCVVRDILGLGEDAVASVARLRILLASEPSIHGSKQPELPSSPGEAFSGIRQLVSNCLSDMRSTGETPPEPIADRSYSGRFIVRVPAEVHRALAIRAAEEGVSLNRLVSARLAAYDSN